MRLLDTIEDNRILELNDSRVLFVAAGRIDNDGPSNPDHDPAHQDETSLRYHGKSIDAYQVPFTVAHPSIIKKTKGIVLGSICYVTNLANGLSVVTVVADIGPPKRLGEVSVAAAKLLGLNPSPLYGGTDLPIIGYEILVGTPATINGVAYDLQSSS